MEWQDRIQVGLAKALRYKLPLTQASPAALEINCGLRCNLVPYSQVPFTSPRGVVHVPCGILRALLARHHRPWEAFLCRFV